MILKRVEHCEFVCKNSTFRHSLLLTQTVDTIMQTATSISVLKGITGTSNEIAILLGAVTPGDGGGGTFYYDSASIETQNDGTIVKPTAVTNGRWKRIFSDTINVKWFASKVVSGNWSPAFQAGIDLGNSIFIPSGSYRIDTPLTNNGDTSVVGESVSTVTLYTTSDINIFNFTNNGLITIRNLQLVASLAQTTGAAINIQSPGGVRRVGIIENIRIL